MAQRLHSARRGADVNRVLCRMLPLALLACGSMDDDGDDAYTDTGVPAWCDDAPVLTWNNFGQGFVTEHCQACHASTAEERNGAPSDVVFDTREETLARADQLLARAAGADATMPPRGGVSDDDKEMLEIWLQCWEGE